MPRQTLQTPKSVVWCTVHAPTLCSPYPSINDLRDTRCGQGDPESHVWVEQALVCRCRTRLRLANVLELA